MATLLEAYKKRLAVAESVHQRSHNGAKMSPQKKLLLATLLNNTSKFMNEAFDQSAATQRSALGDYKKFCLNLTTVAVPNLILPELMLTQPMTSFTGFVTYLRYAAGTHKGGVEVGDMFNSVYSLGEMTPDRARYTSAAVSEDIIEQLDGESPSSDKEVSLEWTPIRSVKKVVITHKDGDKTIVGYLEPTDKSEGFDSLIDFGDAGVNLDGKNAAGAFQNGTLYTGKSGDNKVTIKFSSAEFVDADGKKIESITNFSKDTDTVKVLYLYDNIEIPQKVEPTSLPTLKARMSAIALRAKARRIAVYYSQISAFQAKQDYGFDLGDQLAQQAQGELAYEVDTEGVQLLYNGAEKDKNLNFYAYSFSTLQGISMSQYYEGFNKIINNAKAIIYQRTQKFAPNYMVVGSNVMTILPFMSGWNAAPMGIVNGPYFAGTLSGLKVYVSPAIDPNDFFFGVNGSDLQTSAAVYAPYMSIVPTQLLGFPDGTMTQGFSTMYDMKLLSTYNRNADGTITEVEDGTGKYSYLLVGGKLIDDDKQGLRIQGVEGGTPIAIATQGN